MDVDKKKAEEDEQRRKLRRLVWRDVSLLILGCAGVTLMNYVEANASDASLRGGEAAENGIVDSGYIATYPIYLFLKENRGWNDFFACLNSIALFIPGVYTAYVTIWEGDYDLVFRYFATHLLRSFCGWFTFLPPDKSYLMSYYDFPDIMHCKIMKDCGDPLESDDVVPFVSFFSGHVATMVACANHMYLHGHRRMGVITHVVNGLQVVRLLATRGHYSIDMIIGWYVAVYVSNPAGRLGRYYSRGKSFSELVMPTSATEAFETVTGVANVRAEARASKLLSSEEMQTALKEMKEDDRELLMRSVKETTARLAAEGKLYEYSSTKEKEN